jgi:hypothetical protein
MNTELTELTEMENRANRIMSSLLKKASAEQKILDLDEDEYDDDCVFPLLYDKAYETAKLTLSDLSRRAKLEMQEESSNNNNNVLDLSRRADVPVLCRQTTGMVLDGKMVYNGSRVDVPVLCRQTTGMVIDGKMVYNGSHSGERLMGTPFKHLHF